jgi:hypothetical protein
MQRTLDDVRREGLQALCDRLGKADMIRFLQQFEPGSGDYSQERQTWAKAVSLEEIERIAANDGAGASKSN